MDLQSHTSQQSSKSARITLDWDEVVRAERHARRLRAEVFTRAFLALLFWRRNAPERAGVSLDCGPTGDCA